jgi:putative transposase
VNLEITVIKYIDWRNHRHLHGEIGLVPPAEHEDDFHRHDTAATTGVGRRPARPACPRC